MLTVKVHDAGTVIKSRTFTTRRKAWRYISKHHGTYTVTIHATSKRALDK